MLRDFLQEHRVKLQVQRPESYHKDLRAWCGGVTRPLWAYRFHNQAGARRRHIIIVRRLNHSDQIADLQGRRFIRLFGGHQGLFGEIGTAPTAPKAELHSRHPPP